MIVKEALVTAREALSEMDNARLEAEWLVAHAAQTVPSKIILSENREIDSKWLAQALRRRLEGEPLAYIVEEKGFFKHTFAVKPGVLIPRPETEHVVETALHLFEGRPPARICDIGCGSGCIGLSLLAEWPLSKLMAVDRSAIAIDVTKQNARQLKIEDRCEFLQANVLDRQMQGFDLIVANPPYIDANDERTEANVKKFEPAEALFSNSNGLADIFAWSKWAWNALNPGGWWIVEIGAGQERAVEAKLSELGFQGVQFERDLAGHIRVVFGRK